MDVKTGSTFLLHSRKKNQHKDSHYLRVKVWKKILQVNELKKQASIAILLSNKMDFKPKLIRRDREGYLILIKRKIHQDDILVLSIIYPKHKGTQVHKKNP